MASIQTAFALDASLFDGFSWESDIPSAFVADQTASSWYVILAKHMSSSD
jgi:hypothetical protein